MDVAEARRLCVSHIVLWTHKTTNSFLAERYVRFMASAVRLSSVTLLHPKQRLQLFGNIFASPNSSGIRTVCVKILGKNSRCSRDHGCKLNTKGVWKIAGFQPNLALFRNGTRYGHSYNGRRIGTRIRSIESCHFQWPSMTPNPNFKGTPLFDV